MILVGETDQESCHILVTCSPFTLQGTLHGLLILEDVSAIIGLGELLSICSHCKKIRIDDQGWEHIESHLQRMLDVEFSHGICPECLVKHYAD